MKKSLGLLMLLVLVSSCDAVIKKVEAEKAESEKKVQESLQIAQEVSKYADCVIEAKTPEDDAKCEEVKKTLSPKAQERLNNPPAP